MDDYSASVAQMRTTADPGEDASESQPTSLQGEIERLRFAILETKQALDGGLSYWYESPTTNVVNGTGSSTDNAVAKYDGTAGNIQDSGVTISDTNVVSMADLVITDGANTTVTGTFAAKVYDNKPRELGSPDEDTGTAGEIVRSDSCGLFTRDTGISTAWAAVTNLSVTLAVVGKPVKLKLVSDGSANPASMNLSDAGGAYSSSPTAELRIKRDSTVIAHYRYGVFPNSSYINEGYMPVGVDHIDVPSAGTYTYTVEMRVLGTGEANLNYYKRS